MFFLELDRSCAAALFEEGELVVQSSRFLSHRSDE